jgi:hypothetical protein
MSGDAVSLIQDRLRRIAAAYGFPDARISLFPTLLLVALRDGEPAIVGTIDSVRQSSGSTRPPRSSPSPAAPSAPSSHRRRRWPSCGGSWPRATASGRS